ncbi:hypothetical protein TNCV_2437501 [Trichonephila clavipes]|nr:hypothetical protein TNCV_2437501 [Trichonephila clavipes]
MIPDMNDSRQIWVSGRPRKDSLVTPLPCEAKNCLVEKCLLEAVAGVAIHVFEACHGHTVGSILGVTVYCMQWHRIPSHQLWKRCVAVKQRQHTTLSPHTNTIVITAEIESGFVAKDDLVPFRCSQFPRARHHFKRRRRWVDVKSRTRNGRHDPKCPSARCL